MLPCTRTHCDGSSCTTHPTTPSHSLSHTVMSHPHSPTPPSAQAVRGDGGTGRLRPPRALLPVGPVPRVGATQPDEVPENARRSHILPAPGWHIRCRCGAYSSTHPAQCLTPPFVSAYTGGYRDDIGFLPRLLQPSEARYLPPPLVTLPLLLTVPSYSPAQVYFVNGTPPMWAALYGENTTQEPHWEEFPHSRYARYAFHVTALPVHGPRGLRDWRMYSVGGFNSSGGRTSCMEEFSCYHSQWAQMACVGPPPCRCIGRPLLTPPAPPCPCSGAQHAAPTAIVLLLAALSAVSSLLSAG